MIIVENPTYFCTRLPLHEDAYYLQAYANKIGKFSYLTGALKTILLKYKTGPQRKQ